MTYTFVLKCLCLLIVGLSGAFLYFIYPKIQEMLDNQKQLAKNQVLLNERFQSLMNEVADKKLLEHINKAERLNNET